MEPPTYTLGHGGGSSVGPHQDHPKVYQPHVIQEEIDPKWKTSQLRVTWEWRLFWLSPPRTSATVLLVWALEEPGTKAAALRTADPAEQHCNTDSFLEPANVLPALLFRMVFRSHSRLGEGVLSPLP